MKSDETQTRPSSGAMVLSPLQAYLLMGLGSPADQDLSGDTILSEWAK